MSKNQFKYVIVEQSFEYNDEYYYPVDGYHITCVYNDKDKAFAACEKLNAKYIYDITHNQYAADEVSNYVTDPWDLEDESPIFNKPYQDITDEMWNGLTQEYIEKNLHLFPNLLRPFSVKQVAVGK